VSGRRMQRGAGRGNRSTGERLSRPLEGAKPARRGLHLLSPLFGSDTAPAPVTSLRLLESKSTQQPFTVHVKCHSRALGQPTALGVGNSRLRCDTETISWRLSVRS
jgi:hypothetical protein